jgi:hypothetical protein
VPKDLTLSELVRSYIETLDWENDTDLPPEERAEAVKGRQLVEFIVESTVRSREMFTDAKLEAVERLVAAEPSLIADFLDDYFTREVIDAIWLREMDTAIVSARGKTSAVKRDERIPERGCSSIHPWIAPGFDRALSGGA